MKDVNEVISDIEFNGEVEFPHGWDATNPADLERWIVRERDEDVDMSALEAYLTEFNAQEATISQADIKTVFVMLKDREIHPAGEFDKRGRFYLNDSELVDVRAPSATYPYSQMTAGRTAKFVKAVAQKYRCATLEDLLARFNTK